MSGYIGERQTVAEGFATVLFGMTAAVVAIGLLVWAFQPRVSYRERCKALGGTAIISNSAEYCVEAKQLHP